MVPLTGLLGGWSYSCDTIYSPGFWSSDLKPVSNSDGCEFATRIQWDKVEDTTLSCVDSASQPFDGIVEEKLEDEVIDLPNSNMKAQTVASGNSSGPGVEVLNVPPAPTSSPAKVKIPPTQASPRASDSIDRLAEVVAGLAATVGSLAEMQATSAVKQQEVQPMLEKEEVVEVIDPLKSGSTALVIDNEEISTMAKRKDPIAEISFTRKERKNKDRPRSLGPHFFDIGLDDTESDTEVLRQSPSRSQSPGKRARKSPKNRSKSVGGVVDGSVSEFGVWLCQQRPRLRFNQASGLAWDFPLDQSEKRELLIAHMAIGEHEAKEAAEKSSLHNDMIARSKRRLFSHARRGTKRLSLPGSRKMRPISCSRSKQKSLGPEDLEASKRKHKSLGSADLEAW